MTVSLIISTYNWPEALELVLLSVAKQSVLPDQIVIADDGSDQRTAALIAGFRRDLPIEHVWHEDNGFQKTLILNKALKVCKTDYIIEIDGDIILHKHFIKDHIASAERGFFVQGSRAMIGEQLSEKTLRDKKMSFSCLTNGMTTRFNAIRFPLFSGIFKTNPYSSHNVKGCNLAFWLDDYVRINGYFNGFTGWGWEDYEFAERLINSGIKKKRLKWAAIGYHIFHPLSSRSNFKPNEMIYRETVDNKMWHRTPGFHEVVGI
ncbi:glycosyltransferase family 2 protein [Sphingobacterium griseoflavum]|uniref:Glycosyl transferase family 2 n=1 Tax=Sphingobacterium griseoflavum TaxID=1474952 RepID=A0ABQ3I0U9_9SPHI|nr:glycosyltransferase family 2 protein [Sphingobacterium griseoflavum]GHE43571.1 glycosyl transferase family 2 [Sphingobacterium griseoflavum]